MSASLGEEEQQDRTAPLNPPADSVTRLDSAPLASDVLRRLGLAVLAITLSFLVSAIFIGISGKNPALAYWSLIRGAFGSIDSIAFALNKSTPYVLAGVGEVQAALSEHWERLGSDARPSSPGQRKGEKS